MTCGGNDHYHIQVIFFPSHSPPYIVSLTEQPDQLCLTSSPTPGSHPRGEEFADSTSVSHLLSKSAFQGPAQAPGPSESLAGKFFPFAKYPVARRYVMEQASLIYCLSPEIFYFLRHSASSRRARIGIRKYAMHPRCLIHWPRLFFFPPGR